jgi:hypothetical protein
VSLLLLTLCREMILQTVSLECNALHFGQIFLGKVRNGRQEEIQSHVTLNIFLK